MASTIKLTSELETINSQADYCQLEIIFTDNSASDVTEYTMKEKGISVLNWGTIEHSYDIEDGLLVPAKLSIQLSDAQGLLKEYFFKNDSIEKQAYVRILINNVTEFSGNILEDTLQYDIAKYTVQFQASPKLDILNNTKLYDDAGNYLNPAEFPATGQYYLSDYLRWIYRLINTGISVQIINDWTFRGTQMSSPYTVREDLLFQNLECFASKLAWHPSDYSLTTVADMLRLLAINFCSFTGMLTNEKAFFKKLFYYNPNNLQSIDGKVLTHMMQYEVQLVDYVKVSLDTIPNDGYDAVIWELGDGNKANIEGKSLKKDIYFGFYSAEGTPPGNSQPLTIKQDGLRYQVTAIRDPKLLNGEFTNQMHQLICEFWYNYRHTQSKMRIDNFTVFGINYNILKDFNYENEMYQPISVVRNLEENTTEIKAICLGSL